MLAELASLARNYRSAWVVPLEAGRPRLWQVDDLGAGVTRARSELQAVSSSFDLVAPIEELRQAQATSRAAGRRLAVVGGEAAALLFAFALLAAMTLRTDLAAARRRLAWYGARGWQLALLTVEECALLALAGTALGLGSRRPRARSSPTAAARPWGTSSRAASSRPRGSGSPCSSQRSRRGSSSPR